MSFSSSADTKRHQCEIYYVAQNFNKNNQHIDLKMIKNETDVHIVLGIYYMNIKHLNIK